MIFTENDSFCFGYVFSKTYFPRRALKRTPKAEYASPILLPYIKHANAHMTQNPKNVPELI